MPETHWTPSLVEECFAEAALVMRRLPDVCVPGRYNSWPRILYEFSDLVSQEPSRGTRVRPSADAISRMEETLGWLNWLEPTDRKVIWLRASGVRWKVVCGTVGLARAACHEHWLFDCRTSQRPSSATQLLTSPRHCRSARSELTRSR